MTTSRGVHCIVDGDYVSPCALLVLSDYASLSTPRYIQYKGIPRLILTLVEDELKEE